MLFEPIFGPNGQDFGGGQILFSLCPNSNLALAYFQKKKKALVYIIRYIKFDNYDNY